MTQQTKTLLEEARRELFHYPEITPKGRVKYVVKRLIRPSSAPRRNPFFWPQAMLTQALEAAGDITTLEKYYTGWLNRGIPLNNPDDLMNGYSLLYLYEHQGNGEILTAGEKLLQYLLSYKKEMKGILPYRKNHPSHIYVDGIGMTAPFLTRFGQITKRQEACELAVEQMRLFLEHGMDKATGLCYHGYDARTKEKQGIIGWGRAIGWLGLALADSLEFLPENGDKRELMEGFRRLIEAVMPWQREDGYFSWQLQAIEGPKDTSATAMIAYMVLKGCHLGVLEQNHEEQLKKLEKAILASVKQGKIYDCSGECEGFGRYPQIYGAYPWSLGPGLRFLLERGK